MTDAVEVHVDDSTVAAVMVGDTWVNVQAVVVGFADFTVHHATGPTTVHGTGLYLSATIRQGPNTGDRILVPLDQVQALRTT